MKKIKNILVLIVGIVFIVPYALTTLINGQGASEEAIRDDSDAVSVEVNGQVDVVSEDEYILGVLAYEVPVDYSLQAMKAQAVIIRTELAINKLEEDMREEVEEGDEEERESKNNTTFLNYTQIMEKWKGKDPVEVYKDLKIAVDETRGQVLTVDKNVKLAHYMGLEGRSYEEIIEFFYKDVKISNKEDEEKEVGEENEKEIDPIALMELENEQKNN